MHSNYFVSYYSVSPLKSHMFMKFGVGVALGLTQQFDELF